MTAAPGDTPCTGDAMRASAHRPLAVVIYGSRADGHAKVLIDLLAADRSFTVVGLIDDYPENRLRVVRDMSVMGTGHDLDRLRKEGIEGGVLGFGGAAGRLQALERVRRAELRLPSFVHATAYVSPSAFIEDGAQVLVGAYVGPDARLARGVLVNTCAVVEHDAVLEPGAVVGPGAVLAGRAQVGEAASIGANATILPDRSVGAGAVIGAGAVVSRDVPAGVIAVGRPARW